MRRNIFPAIAVSLCVLVTLSIGKVFSGHTTQGEYIEGIWLGNLTIPGATELRMGVTISRSAQGALGASLRIIDQNTGDIPFDEIRLENNILFGKINHLGIEMEGTTNPLKNEIQAEFRQRGAKFPLPLARVSEMPVLQRPQEPQNPYPYMEEQVEYCNQKDNVKLAATLTHPKTGGPFPAVILLTGSGKQTRDVEAYGHKFFLVLADHLTRQGIAVLRADDRGVGGSTGNFEQSCVQDFAEDASAGVEYLKTRKEILPGQIGLIGHSEGGMTAPIAATKSPDVAFIVLMAAPGIDFAEMVIFQIAEHLKLEGVSEEDIALQRTWRKRLYSVFKENLDDESMERKMQALYAELSADEIERMKWPKERLEFEIKRSKEPGWNFAMSYDPRSTLTLVQCPVLAINGEKDMQNPSQMNLSAIEEALKANSNRSFTVKEIPGLNHLFQTAETGSEYEYGKIEETMSPAAMQMIAEWILGQVQNVKKI